MSDSDRSCPLCDSQLTERGGHLSCRNCEWDEAGSHRDSDRSDGVQEVDVPLGKYDMDHLSEGQPVFKPAGEDMSLVLRFDDCQEWNRVPIGVLEDLADEWVSKATAQDGVMRHPDKREGLNECAQELRELIADYGDTDE